MNSKTSSILLLSFATLIWGAGFVGTRWTLVHYSPLWSNSLRFIFAAILAMPLLFKRGQNFLKIEPIVCSVILIIALQFQTYGIKYTTLTKSGFLTTFYAIFTPILSYFFLKRSFGPFYWFLVLLAMIGIAFLCELKFSNFNKGDAFILASALFFSFHILAIDKYAPKFSSIELNFFQIIYMGAWGLIFGLLFEGMPDLTPLYSLNSLSLWGFVILAVFSSLLAFTIQVVAQRKIEPHIASMIFLMESVFSAFFGWWIFSENIALLGLIGASFVILSVALVPLSMKTRSRTEML